MESQFQAHKIRDESAGEDGFHIGLYQVGDDSSKWKWSDGAGLFYTNWMKNKPESRHRKCGYISTKSI